MEYRCFVNSHGGISHRNQSPYGIDNNIENIPYRNNRKLMKYEKSGIKGYSKMCEELFNEENQILLYYLGSFFNRENFLSISIASSSNIWSTSSLISSSL